MSAAHRTTVAIVGAFLLIVAASGAGDAECFALFIPIEWSTGRWGIGTQVNFPAENPKFGSDKWKSGFAPAWLERLGD